MSIAPGASITEAAREMKKLDVGALPVVVESGKAVGIVTDRDIVIRAIAEGKEISTLKVRDVMSKELDMCGQDDPVEQAAAQMKRDKIRRMLALDGEGNLAGIVSMADIVLKGAKETACDVLEGVSEPEK